MWSAAIAIISIALLSVACATSSERPLYQSEDFGSYRTWQWLPDSGPTLDVPSTASSVEDLDRELARLVERALAVRDFERVAGGGDLLVSARLGLQRETVKVFETGAMQQLSSHHVSPSYQVQSTVERRVVRERTRLVIAAIDTRLGKVVWRGVIEQRVRGRLTPHIAAQVSALLEPFPSAAPPRSRLDRRLAATGSR